AYGVPAAARYVYRLAVQEDLPSESLLGAGDHFRLRLGHQVQAWPVDRSQAHLVPRPQLHFFVVYKLEFIRAFPAHVTAVAGVISVVEALVPLIEAQGAVIPGHARIGDWLTVSATNLYAARFKGKLVVAQIDLRILCPTERSYLRSPECRN